MRLIAGLISFLRKYGYWITAIAIISIVLTLIIKNREVGWWLFLPIFLTIAAAAILTPARQFHSASQAEINELLQRSVTSSIEVKSEEVGKLPQCVQRWLRCAGVVGRSLPSCVQITQQGSLRTSPSGKWMPFTASEVFTTDPPSFLWDARIKAGPMMTIAGRDKLSEGHGNTIIKPFYVFTLTQSRGPAIDESTLVRYLAEMAWFPQSALSHYVRWDRVDDRSATATISHNGTSSSGTYLFGSDGLVSGFEANRYGEFDGVIKREIWSIRVLRYRSFDGVTIGSESEVTWKLKEGDFTWLRMTLTDIRSAT